MLLFACSSLLFSCSQSPDDQPTPPPIPPDTTTVPPITTTHSPRRISETASDAFGFEPSLRFSYDNAGRMNKITYLSQDYTVVYKNDTIDHVLSPVSTFNSQFRRSSSIFVYRPDKKCVKVFTKYIESYDQSVVADTNPFFTDTSNRAGVTVDSLVYSPTGQLTEIWNVLHQADRMQKLEYQSSSDEVPIKMISWSGLELTLKFTDMEQPAYKQLWFLCFLRLSVPVCPTIPPYNYPFYLVLLKKPIKQWSVNSSGTITTGNNYIYRYNADSTAFTGRAEPDDIIFSRFSYLFTGN
jgi:hypothetical protein